jgi:hypothetical protein
VIVSVFVRRLKEGATFEDFLREWEADVGFGIATRVFNAQSLSDPRDIFTVGFVDIDADAFAEWVQAPHDSEQVRHDRIDTVIESTTLKAQYDLRTEHDFTQEPTPIELGSAQSLLHLLVGGAGGAAATD